MRISKETKVEIGKFLLDIAKLIIGGVFLSTIYLDKINVVFVLTFSVITLTLFILIGFKLINSK